MCNAHKQACIAHQAFRMALITPPPPPPPPPSWSDELVGHAEGAESSGVAMAVASDDGAVRIFRMQPGVSGLQYERTMPRIESRALSAAWHPSGSVLIAGYGDGCLRAWHVPSARELLRITAGEQAASHTMSLNFPVGVGCVSFGWIGCR